MELNYLLHQSVSGFIMQTCHRKLYIKMTNGPFNSGIWKVTGAVADIEGCVCCIHQDAVVYECDAWQFRMRVDFYFPLCILVMYSCHVERWWLALWRPQILYLHHSLEHSEHQGFGEWTRECRVMVSVFPSESYLGLSSLVISQGSRKWMEKEKKMRQWDSFCDCHVTHPSGGQVSLGGKFLGLRRRDWLLLRILGPRALEKSCGFSELCVLFAWDWLLLLSFFMGAQRQEWKTPTECATLGKSFTALGPVSLLSKLQSHSCHLHQPRPFCVTCLHHCFQWAKFLFW